MLGSGLLSSKRPKVLPLPGGAANITGLLPPGPGAGGASYTGRGAIQPTLSGFAGRYRHTAIPGVAPSKQADPKLTRRAPDRSQKRRNLAGGFISGQPSGTGGMFTGGRR
jgi:hypothetical protein